MAAYAAGFAALSTLRHEAFETGRFDLGNMVQAVWSTAHGDVLGITTLNGTQTVRFAAHVDPILVLFTPLWLVWPSPTMLLTVQAIAIALGALPLFWLARKHLGDERAALGFALAYLLYPATQWLTLSEFHPVALACPLLLYAYWFLDEDRLAPFAAFAVLAAMTKEEVPLVIAGLGAWYAITRKRWATGRRNRCARDCLDGDRGRHRDPALQRRLRAGASTAATRRSAAPRPGSSKRSSPIL